MGKSKKRSIYKGKNEQFTNITRSDAIQKIVQMLSEGDKDVYALITLFGVTAEEVLEAGVSYEIVQGIKNILK